MNIRINDNYRITSDNLNIIVNERRTVDPTKAPGWAKRAEQGADPTPYDKFVEISYHSNVESAIKSIIDHTVKSSDAESVSELLSIIRELKADIDEALTT